ncbi:MULTISPECIES: nuclear transport factor 2 family protein [unclassified Bradyrhizobium]|jgi:hypothetical protein|uniref:nuclear transport factor 2 family protein n=2 Tax=Bradyrhizobium TaxID=374 RepID=UPI00201233D7|nr:MULTISPECIES: nuclear transport factor 2 family protein [unclassified Bradyrhizobium]
MDMSNLPKDIAKDTAKDTAKDIANDIDQVAVVVDWLDACRRQELGPLLDLYASEASLECDCDGANIYAGRAALESYWRPRLQAFSPNAFGLEEITPAADGVMLDYLNSEGKPVRIVFTFDASGKILQTRCAPFAPATARDGAGARDRAW